MLQSVGPVPARSVDPRLNEADQYTVRSHLERTSTMDLTQHHPTHPNPTVAAPADRRLRRPSVNITPIERVGRIVIGLAAIIAGIVLLASVSSALAVILELLLVLAGIDLVVTGALGHCPLYQRLGYVPSSLVGRK